MVAPRAKRKSMPHFSRELDDAQMINSSDWYTLPSDFFRTPCQCTDWRDTDGAIIGTRVCDYCWEKEHGPH